MSRGFPGRGRPFDDRGRRFDDFGDSRGGFFPGGGGGGGGGPGPMHRNGLMGPGPGAGGLMGPGPGASGNMGEEYHCYISHVILLLIPLLASFFMALVLPLSNYSYLVLFLSVDLS